MRRISAPSVTHTSGLSMALLLAAIIAGCGNTNTTADASVDAAVDAQNVDRADVSQSDTTLPIDAGTTMDAGAVPPPDLVLVLPADAAIMPPFDALEFPTPDVLPPPQDEGPATDAAVDASSTTDGSAADVSSHG